MLRNNLMFILITFIMLRLCLLLYFYNKVNPLLMRILQVCIFQAALKWRAKCIYWPGIDSIWSWKCCTKQHCQNILRAPDFQLLKMIHGALLTSRSPTFNSIEILLKSCAISCWRPTLATAVRAMRPQWFPQSAGDASETAAGTSKWSFVSMAFLQ